MENGGRNAVIDISKGLGIIMVIAGHLLCPQSYLYGFIYTFHMPLFLFLAGYVMSDKYLRSGISKRIYPLLLCYAEICLAGFLFVLVVPNGGFSVNVKNVLSMCFVMFMPEVFFCGHLWFIMVLIMCFMLFFVVNNMFKNRLFSAGAAVVIFAAAMLFKRLDAYAVIGNLRFDDPWRICTAMVSFLFFEFGYLAKKNGIIEKIQQKSAVFSAFLLCVCAALTAFAFYINKVVNIVQNVFPLNANPAIFILGSFSGTFMTVAAAVLLEKIGVIKKALSKYGQKSLQIYLTQNWFIVLYSILCINVLKVGIDSQAPLTTYLGFQTGAYLTLPAALIGIVLVCALEIPVVKLFDITFGRLNKYIMSLYNNKKEEYF